MLGCGGFASGSPAALLTPPPARLDLMASRRALNVLTASLDVRRPWGGNSAGKSVPMPIETWLPVLESSTRDTSASESMHVEACTHDTNACAMHARNPCTRKARASTMRAQWTRVTNARAMHARALIRHHGARRVGGRARAHAMKAQCGLRFACVWIYGPCSL